ncbi:MAG: hypothetical protein GXO39_07880 [Thermotogae bacterium]|nr:hypothetical protein [Thermotogota bacterium]
MGYVCVVGDVHGHLQLALSVAHLWQKDLGEEFEAVLLVGDLGAFTSEDRLDKATRKFAERNPMELEFMHQWLQTPPPPWIEGIFKPVSEGGLGIKNVIAIRGNHEDFEYLRSITPERTPPMPVEVEDLPSLDPNGFIKYLPDTWVVRLPSGTTVAGLGGVTTKKKGFLPEEDILELMGILGDIGLVDILLTHQGPEAVQEEAGSYELNDLLGGARYWFHGHAVRNPEIVTVKGTTVVPLEHANFSHSRELDPNGWAVLKLGEEEKVWRGLPKGAPEVAHGRWIRWKFNGKEVFVSPLLWAFLEEK